MTNDPSITIIGAGVGGLVTALQLHAHGFRDINLYEASTQLLSLGVGINVQPSAVLILRNLGLLSALQNTGIETQELNYYDRFGNPIISEPRGKYAGYEVPQFSIHRGKLQMLLLDAVRERLGEDRIHLNHTLDSFENSDDASKQVKLRFIQKKTGEPATNAEVHADLVVAADGINSKVRSILYPAEGPPHFSGRILWRGYLEREPFLTSASMIWSGHANQKFIAYPILNYHGESKTKSMVNWIAELRVRDENDPDTTPPVKSGDWLMSVPKERFAGQFKEWTFGFLNVPELIEKTDKVFEYPMCDRDPVDRWTFGRLTLLGDAAHPMYPIGSNGASQAILDAASLTRHLLALRAGQLPDVPAALQAYQDERLPVTAKIVIANRGNGPDHVMQVAYERAPDGFKHINDIIPQDELEGIGSAYKKIAGFEIDKVNEAAIQTEGVAEKLGLHSPKAWTSDAVLTNGANGKNGTSNDDPNNRQ
ncbi:putative FAD-binding domain, FAD/NAD(P)-binding domain superfamily [Septoria linicola]|nr:putative FAD-binding domain, FAD/NAD(P)-binding domain superfamily [Septoria linicola]